MADSKCSHVAWFEEVGSSDASIELEVEVDCEVAVEVSCEVEVDCEVEVSGRFAARVDVASAEAGQGGPISIPTTPELEVELGIGLGLALG